MFWHPEEKTGSRTEGNTLQRQPGIGIFLHFRPAICLDPDFCLFQGPGNKIDLDSLLTAIITHTSDLQNLYGVKIVNEKLQYADVLSTSVDLNHYPTPPRSTPRSINS